MQFWYLKKGVIFKNLFEYEQKALGDLNSRYVEPDTTSTELQRQRN